MSRLLLALTQIALLSFAADPIRPNPALTPGATLDVTIADVCTVGYTKRVRNVPASLKRQIYANYGITPRAKAYEIDHLISLELGGSNSYRNLWPESYSGEWNAHRKDVLENKLHALVCAGKMPLNTAQEIIAHDWISAYQEYIKPVQFAHK
jgi:hypothetical protein